MNFDEMSPAEIDDLFQVEPQHDPEFQMERMREQLEYAGWDAIEGLVDPGDEYVVEESHLLTPDPLDYTDFEWTLVYREKHVFDVIDPFDSTRGVIPASRDGEDMMQAFGEFAEAFHLECEIDKFHDELGEMEPGEVVLLPSGKLRMDTSDRIVVYNPMYEPVVTTDPENVTVELVESIIDDWRAEMREKYEGTPMEDQFD